MSGSYQLLGYISTKVKGRHTHSETIGYLIENNAPLAISYIAVNFHSAVNRAGMHDEAVGLEPFRAGFGETKEAGVFAEAREILLALALLLDAEEIDDIHFFKDGVDIVRYGDAKLFKAARYKSTGT